MWMQGKGLGNNARKLINAFGTIKSMDVVVPVKRGNIELPVRLRTVAKPEEDVAVLLAHLGPCSADLLKTTAQNKGG